MKWQRYLWTAAILAIWVISLLIVDSAAKQTRMGYQKQKILKQQMELTERNLRLECEVSTLHDLPQAEQFADEKELRTLTGDQIIDPAAKKLESRE